MESYTLTIVKKTLQVKQQKKLKASVGERAQNIYLKHIKIRFYKTILLLKDIFEPFTWKREEFEAVT